MVPLKTISIHYHAKLREERGVGSEDVQTESSTATALYNELKSNHGFSLRIDNLQVAVNNQMVGWDQELISGDEVIFIPPVAGG